MRTSSGDPIKPWFLFTVFLLFAVGCFGSSEEQACKIVESTEPSEVVAQSSEGPEGTPFSVLVEGEYAYLGTTASVRIVDVSDPEAPREVSSISVPGTSIEVVGNYAYLTGGNDLHIFDVSDPGNPVEVRCQNNESFKFAHADIVGDYAFVAADVEGLKVFDVSDPAMLVEVASYARVAPPQIQVLPRPYLIRSQPRFVLDVTIQDDYAYVGESQLGTDSFYDGLIRIFDISNPNKPQTVGSYEMPNGAGVQQIIVSDGYLFASAGYMDTPATIMLDLSDPADPFEVATPPLPVGLVAAHENYVYFADGLSRLKVWQISDPSTPVQFTWDDSHYNHVLDGHVLDAFISGNYAYFATQYGGFRIVDITDPKQPITVSTIPD